MLLWGFTLWFADDAITATYYSLVLSFFGKPFATILFLAAASTGLIGMFWLSVRRKLSITLLFPQQFILWFMTFSATDAIIRQHVDGVLNLDIPWSKLLVNYSPLLLLTFFHTSAIIETITHMRKLRKLDV